MANISYRLGTLSTPDQLREAIKDRGSEAEETLERYFDHLAANGIDWSKSEAVLGPWLEMDPEKERFVGTSHLTFWANQLLKGQYRKPFVIPDQV
jgi:hypothetical protein